MITKRDFILRGSCVCYNLVFGVRESVFRNHCNKYCLMLMFNPFVTKVMFMLIRNNKTTTENKLPDFIICILFYLQTLSRYSGIIHILTRALPRLMNCILVPSATICQPSFLYFSTLNFNTNHKCLVS